MELTVLITVLNGIRTWLSQEEAAVAELPKRYALVSDVRVVSGALQARLTCDHEHGRCKSNK